MGEIMQKKDFKALARILAVSKICEKSDNENLDFIICQFQRIWDNFNAVDFLDWYEDYLNNPTRTINGDVREEYIRG